MDYGAPLVEGVLLRRYKRFLADVVLPDGSEAVAHIANTGKMTGCWETGCAARLRFSDDPKRKLKWSVEQTRVDGHWIGVNTARANTLVGEALRDGRIPELQAEEVRAEVAFPEGGRADFRLDGHTWVEVKNVTLLEGEVLRFPDTVSVRASEHLRKLTAALGRGERAVLLLHVGREGGTVVEPADQLDPAWGRTLREAVDAGLEVLAWRSVFSATDAHLTEPVPFRLPALPAAP